MSAGNAGAHDWPVMAAIMLRPGSDAETARQRILSRLVGDVQLLTPAETRMREIGFTLRAAPIGILFGIGMLAGLLIGAITCYQVLFNEIVDHLKMYTTLKATGFSDWFLRRVIVEQAILLALFGFAVGSLLAWALGAYMSSASGFPVSLAAGYGAVILAITVTTCAGAGLLAVRRVTASDPAALF
jgi:putative ABC transport system permease protein